jgi:hypothetical protein
MTVAAFLNSSHYYTSIADVDDVQDIIDALGTILKTTNDPAWTEPSARTFKSPVDADGRYYTVAVSRVDVDTLQLVVKNQSNTTIKTCRIDIDASGSPAVEVKVYSGQYHLWIDSMRGNPENFRSGILDLSPQSQSAWSTVVYAQSHRDSSGNVTSQYNQILSISGVADAGLLLVPSISYESGANVDPAGNLLYWPSFVNSSNSSRTLLGRMYQVLLGTSSIAFGTEITVPIDIGVTAKFRAAGVPANTYQYTQYRFMVRAD